VLKEHISSIEWAKLGASFCKTRSLARTGPTRLLLLGCNKSAYCVYKEFRLNFYHTGLFWTTTSIGRVPCWRVGFLFVSSFQVHFLANCASSSIVLHSAVIAMIANYIHSQSCYGQLENTKKNKREFQQELELGIMAITRESCLVVQQERCRQDKWVLVGLLNNTTQNRILVVVLLPQEKN